MMLHFDDVAFDAASRQLRVAGRQVALTPKAFDLLALLIERRPHAVSKDEIRRRLWPDTHVADSNLPTLVSEIRRGLGDSARQPGLIRTAHGVGYAFLAQPAHPEAWLTGPAGDIALFAGANVLGREGTGVILLRSSTVSRRHARITIDAAGAVLEDAGSKNGTYVNHSRVTAPSPLADGDRIRFGSLRFTFRTARPAASTETQSTRASDAAPR